MAAAPLFTEVADAPPRGKAVWRQADDGMRLRIGWWHPSPASAPKGTVLLFPGRTEYIEKYGPAARFFTAEGYGLITIDWRGQGLTERAFPDRRLGHVVDFAEYQRDVAALVATARAEGLPEPYFLVAHSMGGCIGLRALHEGLPVRAAAFSAPMWGVKMDWWEPPLAWASAFVAPLPGFGGKLTPRTSLDNALFADPFEGNDLTTDRAMWDFMRHQLEAHPDLVLGGPTLRWLRAALFETRRLTHMPPPDVPARTFLGTHERIVNPAPIHYLMAQWPKGQLVMLEGAEHEIMMEREETRSRFYAASLTLFGENGGD